MADSEPTPEQAVEAIYGYAAQLMREGLAPAQIEERLTEQGLSRDVAATVVRNLTRAKAQAEKEAANKNMLFGALWCVGGIVVTAMTYSAAAGAGGGKYVVAWGAILFGGIQFFRGLFQSSGE